MTVYLRGASKQRVKDISGRRLPRCRVRKSAGICDCQRLITPGIPREHPTRIPITRGAFSTSTRTVAVKIVHLESHPRSQMSISRVLVFLLPRTHPTPLLRRKHRLRRLFLHPILSHRCVVQHTQDTRVASMYARDHVVTGEAILSMQFEDIPADILLYLLDCLGLDDALHLLLVRDRFRSHAHRPDIPDRAEILDLLQAAKIVRQPISLASASAAIPIR
jgi:hypothetical protein